MCEGLFAVSSWRVTPFSACTQAGARTRRAMSCLIFCAIRSLRVRLAGKLAARPTIQNALYDPARVTRCFCSGAANEHSANAAFARELQKRVASAEVSSSSQRLAGVTPGVVSHQCQNRWGVSRLITAVAAAFVSGMLSNKMLSHDPSPTMQKLCPATLRICLHWLQDREALLRSELGALQSLSPAYCDSLRQEAWFDIQEIIADLQRNKVMVTALKAPSQEQV